MNAQTPLQRKIFFVSFGASSKRVQSPSAKIVATGTIESFKIF
jgi:hypothetical protein